MNEGAVLFGGFCLCLLGLAIMIPMGLPNAPYFTGPITGVHVTHEAKPLTELFVEVCLGPNYSDCGKQISGTTDDTGTFTFKAPFDYNWPLSNLVYLYKVTYAGQTYGIKGSPSQVVEDPI